MANVLFVYQISTLSFLPTHPYLKAQNPISADSLIFVKNEM